MAVNSIQTPDGTKYDIPIVPHFYRSSTSNTGATANIAFNNIAVPSGMSVKVGDLILCSNGNIYQVQTIVQSSSASCNLICSIAGDQGSAGSAGGSYTAVWTT